MSQENLKEINQNTPISFAIPLMKGRFYKKGRSYIGDCSICNRKGVFDIDTKYNNWDRISCGYYGKGLGSLLIKLKEKNPIIFKYF